MQVFWEHTNSFVVVKHQVGWTIETVSNFVGALDKLSWVIIADSEGSTVDLIVT